MMRMKITHIIFLICFFSSLTAQVPQPILQLLKADYMKGASFSLIAKEVKTGEILYSYDEQRQVIPASVLKTVTTATALELLGNDYRFPTYIEYDGEIVNGVLTGNLYIKGSGDPTLGSAHLVADRNTYTLDQNTFIPQWIAGIKEAGIKSITGAVIADESIFDTEGISPKWLWEDMGSYYGAASYGLNVFDNLFHLELSTGNAGEQPAILRTKPEMKSLNLYNHLVTASVATDSAFIMGAPYSTERYLYGVVPVNRNPLIIKGDIPNPPLFLAEYLNESLHKNGITIEGKPSCSSIDRGEKQITKDRKVLITTYSPPLSKIVRITNERSHNLYADAVFKTLGLSYQSQRGEFLSSYGKASKAVEKFWKEKGMDISTLWMYDGSGLASTDKVSAAFMGEMLTYMATRSPESEAFMQSFPKVGQEGTVRNFLRGSSLQGRAVLKSGGMSRVKSYAGYITKDRKQYAVAVFVNNYNCEGREMTRALEKLLLALFE